MMTSTSAPKKFAPKLAFSAAESRGFALLETAFGDTLWEILKAYIRGGDHACEKLQEATSCAHWLEAARQALKIASLAADLEFRVAANAARAFATAVYEKQNAHACRNAAQMAVLEFEKTKLLIESRYPGLVETNL